MTTIVGIDVGGTFTDFYCAPPDGPTSILKVPSTPGDPSAGLLNALAASGLAAQDIALIIHGTTIATNAVIERRGARCALLTTRGFRDVLELGRRDRPHMYGMTGEQRPLIARDLRFEVTERLDAQGNVLTPLDEAQIRAVGQVLRDEGIEAIVVSFLHCYANPIHELAAARLLAEINPAWEIVPSHAVCNEYFEFERTSTAGMHRGGCGTAYGITALSDCLVSVLGDRVDHAPFGVVGGGDALPNRVRFHTDGKDWVPEMRSKADKVPLTAGDSVHLATPGGGGFGDPLERNFDKVERDLDIGFISRETAQRTYGAVIASETSVGDYKRYQLDREASEKLRTTLRSSNSEATTRSGDQVSQSIFSINLINTQ